MKYEDMVRGGRFEEFLEEIPGFIAFTIKLILASLASGLIIAVMLSPAVALILLGIKIFS